MSKVVSFDDLANNIKQQLAGPLSEWTMPRHNSIVEPYNPVSGNTYKGGNAVTLINAAQNFGCKSDQWASFFAWAKKGARVRKGVKATQIYIPIFKDASKKDVANQNGDESIRGFRALNIYHPSTSS